MLEDTCTLAASLGTHSSHFINRQSSWFLKHSNLLSSHFTDMIAILSYKNLIYFGPVALRNNIVYLYQAYHFAVWGILILSVARDSDPRTTEKHIGSETTQCI